MNSTITLAIDQKFNTATQQHMSGNLQQAEEIYKSILMKAPDYSPALQNYGLLLLQNKNFPLAEKLLQKVISSSTTDEQLLVNFAMLKTHLTKLGEATEIIERVLAINPDNKAGNGILSRITLLGDEYLTYLSYFHEWLKPQLYVEIGVHHGNSLVLADQATQTIGIDPDPKVSQALNSNTQIYSLTSESFFAQYDLNSHFNNRPIDLSFIDGLHQFEAALKDFINIEKYSKKESIILIHDCIPLNKITSERERVTDFWSGDVWKIVPCLKKYRPDLTVFTIPSPPTGLSVVTNLDPDSDILSKNYENILNEYVPLDYSYIESNKNNMLNITESDWNKIKKRARSNNY